MFNLSTRDVHRYTGDNADGAEADGHDEGLQAQDGPTQKVED
jgi:hypothetical protein